MLLTFFLFFLTVKFVVLLIGEGNNGRGEKKKTPLDNELLNHPYWKRSVLFGKCEILKDSFEQFELIRTYKIIFGKWHLSLDERIFFSDPKLMSFKWVFFSPPPLLLRLQWTRSMSQQCHLRISRRSWRSDEALHSLASHKMFGAIQKTQRKRSYSSEHCW